MNARTSRTVIATCTLAVVSLTAAAQAQTPLDDVRKIVRQVERIGADYIGQPQPCPVVPPQPWPTPQPCPTPQPQPWPMPTPIPLPGPLPSPEPAPVSYFLGVYTSTVPVGQSGGVPVDGPQAYVVPGYGEQVYGQRVNRIVPNSPAFHAGLEEGDIIINANGFAMDSRELLQAAIDTSEGYMEMQVLDGRSGDLVWVVAETDPQNSVPMVAATDRTGSNGTMPQAIGQPSVKRQGNVANSRTTPSVRSGQPSSNLSNGRSLNVPTIRLQQTPAVQMGPDGRRSPVRRR